MASAFVDVMGSFGAPPDLLEKVDRAFSFGINFRTLDISI